MNPYGFSKHEFDIWALSQKKTPPAFYGLKFFNVYGPNEYHKGRMASVVFHAVNQIKTTGKMRLFRSHVEGIENGMQKRDFIYIKDVLNVCLFLMRQKPADGIYNVGTGKARSFIDLVNQIFRSLDLDPDIEFIDIPEDIRNTYQYFTEAEVGKLKDAGYQNSFTSLEEGVDDYIKSYLLTERIY